MGEISQIEVDILKEALETLKQNTVLQDSEIAIEVERSNLECRECGNVWPFEDVRNELEPISPGKDNPVHYLPESIDAFVDTADRRNSRLGVLDDRGCQGFHIRIHTVVKEMLLRVI